MRSWYGIAIGILAVLIAFKVGYSRGLSGCPAMASVMADRQAAIDRDVAQALGASSDRDAVCDQVFDIIGDEIGNESFREQSDRSAQRGDPRE